MALELNITPEDIEALVRDSIMRCGFGKAVEDAIKKVFTGYNNPIDVELKRYVSELCSTLLREKYRAAIYLATTKAIEERVTEELITKTVSVAVEKMVRAADERY